MSKEQRHEAVLRGRAAARAGYSIHTNPYDRGKQADLWDVWRFSFADASPEPAK